MTGAQSDSIGPDIHGSDPVAGNKSEGPATQISLDVESMFVSNAYEYAASVAGSIHPSSDDAICPGFRSGAAPGAVSRILSDSRSKSCLS